MRGDPLANWLGSTPSARRASRGPTGGLTLVLICLSVYLPGLFAIPPIDRDEARFAQASRQMLESVTLAEEDLDPRLHAGGLVVPMVQDRVRLNKPPLIYWLQLASAAAFTGGRPLDDAVWMYRVPGVLCAIASVLLTWRLGIRLFDPRAAWLGAALLAVCPLVVVDAHQARADQLLLTTVLATQYCLWRLMRASLRGRALAWACAVWACIAVGILAKGPITPMLAALTAVSMSLATGRWKWMLGSRLAVGLPIVLLLVGPWVFGVVQHVGWDRYVEIVREETVGRSLEAKEGHWGPPGYHTVLLAVLFWPGSLLTAAAIRRGFTRGLPRNGPRIWNRRASRAGELFCLSWIIPAWIVFEAIGTKLPHYPMPMYPAIALLSARAILGLSAAARTSGTWRPRIGAGLWVWATISAVVCIAVPLAGAYAGAIVAGSRSLAVVGVMIALAGAALLVLGLASRSAAVAQGWSIAAAVVFTAGMLQWMLPDMKPPWVTSEIMRVLDRNAIRLPEVNLASIGFHEDSLVFATRGRLLKFDDPARGRQFLGAGDQAVLIIPHAMAGEFPGVTVLGTASGFNYATGKSVRLDIVQRSHGARP